MLLKLIPMHVPTSGNGIQGILNKLHHYLPAQAPLKDFIHHNTLHAFQDLPFHKAVAKASRLFGFRGYLSLREYRQLYKEGRINDAVLDQVIVRLQGNLHVAQWRKKVLYDVFDTIIYPQVGHVRQQWKDLYKINLDKITHPLLFRIISSYLDQGISLWHFPTDQGGFLASLRELERNSFYHFFRSKRVRQLLLNTQCTIESLLDILVKDDRLYEHYLFDQQFSHPGWSGMVAVLEKNPSGLLDERRISLEEFIILELLLEIDALDQKFNENWSPLGLRMDHKPESLFDDSEQTEIDQVFQILQEAFEWSYYDEVLAGIRMSNPVKPLANEISFQGLFCIDDRCCSLRRYLEKEDPSCATYGTPGFFNVGAYFQPEHSHFHTKICPAPMQPNHLVVEQESLKSLEKDLHFSKYSHSPVSGWLLSQTLGFWSAIKLFINIFYPSATIASVSSFGHMDKDAKLQSEYDKNAELTSGLKRGFTVLEMADSTEQLLKSIGLINNFAPIIYIVGHGASSVNNTHYAGYDCGACSGRPGSVNARIAAFRANHPEVRHELSRRGMVIPEKTRFIGGLHDTTTDEIEFYDVLDLDPLHQQLHEKHNRTFIKALHQNAKERSRRFILNNTRQSPEKIHKQVKKRAVSLFEPRPEYNHATNALAIVSRRSLVKHLFLDRRSFLNSYDYTIDPDGALLLGILQAVAPVCGGINLEYYFSRVDTQRLGAGSKLPHNVMGLIGVANGADGDLRPGLPFQMVEIHDPVRLMVIVEHYPEIIHQTLQRSAPTWEWFRNEWIHLVAVHPTTLETFILSGEVFVPYLPLTKELPKVSDIMPLVESAEANFPVYILQD